MKRIEPPPPAYFVGGAVFHYLGPAFAVLLFARAEVLGVAWLRIAAATAVFAPWRRPWRAYARMSPSARRVVVAWGAVLAVMNACFYLAIDRLPLGTVAAVEFLPVIALAALGARTPRNVLALLLAVAGVYVLADVRLEGERSVSRSRSPTPSSSRSTSCSGTASPAAARPAVDPAGLTRWGRRCSSRSPSRRRWRAGPQCPRSPTRSRSRRGSASASRPR